MLEVKEYCFIASIALLVSLCVLVCIAACLLSKFQKVRKAWNNEEIRDKYYCLDIEEQIRNIIAKTDELHVLTKKVHDLHNVMNEDGICSDKKVIPSDSILTTNLLSRIPDKIEILGLPSRRLLNDKVADKDNQHVVQEESVLLDSEQSLQEVVSKQSVNDVKSSYMTSDVSITPVGEEDIQLGCRR